MSGFRRSAAVAAVLSSAALIAACGGGGGNGGSSTSKNKNASSGGGTTAAAAPDCKPVASGTKVNLTYTSFVPQMQRIVKRWNATHPNIHVTYHEVPSGIGGTYQKYLNQIKSRTTNDVGVIEYQYLPTFRLQDGLANIAGCPATTGLSSQFPSWAWNQVTFNEQGSLFGIPADQAPMAYFYRKDLFDKNGLQPPKTWDDFYALAQKVKGLGGRAVNFSAFGTGFYEGLVAQAGGKWFTNKGSNWTIDIDSPQTTKVSDYWHKILENKLASTYSLFGPEYVKAINDNSMWGMIGGAWCATYIAGSAPKQSGDWRVAPLPTWDANTPTDGNWGGAATIVFKNTKHPAEAAEFAAWVNTDPEAQKLNTQYAGILPAATTAFDNVPALSEGTKYLGGQKQWDLFSRVSDTVKRDWEWGPTELQTAPDLSNGLGAAINGKQTLNEVMTKLQAQTVAAFKAQSIPVTGD
jgi:multiple sugar transport system substrate-binding protein